MKNLACTLTRTLTLLASLCLATSLTVACGGGDGDGDGDGDSDAGPDEPNAGFITPDVITTAYTGGDGSWTEVGPADWSCLGTASSDMASTLDITVTGSLEDFQTGNKLPDGTITAYGDTNFSGAGLVMATSNEDGDFSLVLPTGQTRVAFKVTLEDALDTYSLNQYFEPAMDMQTADINSVSLLTANALPAFIGVMRTPGLGILAGVIRDCAGNEVGGAIATVSSTSATVAHLDGAETYYFSAGSTSLPVRHTQQLSTNTDGLFVAIELPSASTAYLQVWGFIDGQDPTTDELTLIGELPSPVLADSVITADVEALRN